jgi:hypothetical protein
MGFYAKLTTASINNNFGEMITADILIYVMCNLFLKPLSEKVRGFDFCYSSLLEKRLVVMFERKLHITLV